MKALLHSLLEAATPVSYTHLVRLRLLEAVSAVTGLSTDRITVVKMRS